MTYKIVKRQAYFYPVEVNVVQDGGAVMTYEFNAQFKRLPEEQIAEIRANPSQFTDRGVATLVMVGWDGVQDESGQPMPFNEDSLNQLLSDNGVAFAVSSAWFASIAKELRKN